MRPWWWATDGIGDLATIQVSFQRITTGQVHLKPLVEAVNMPGLVRAAPEAVAAWNEAKKQDADYYFDEYTYSRLPFFTGRNYYGFYEQLTVLDSALFYEDYGSKREYDPQRNRLEFKPQRPPGALTQLIAFLICAQGLMVEHWKVTAGPYNDPLGYVADGDHQALIKYLELDQADESG